MFSGLCLGSVAAHLQCCLCLAARKMELSMDVLN